MHTKITGRHMEVTESMRSYVEKKISKLQRYYNRISEMEVVIEEEGSQHKIELIVKADNHQRFVVQHTLEDGYACFDAALDKIERKLTKHKEKSRIRKGRIGTAEAAFELMEQPPSEETEEENQE